MRVVVTNIPEVLLCPIIEVHSPQRQLPRHRGGLQQTQHRKDHRSIAYVYLEPICCQVSIQG